MAEPRAKSGAAGRVTRTIGYYAAFISLGLVSASLGPTLPGLAAQTGVVLSEVSLLFVCRSTGYLLGSVFGGRLYDRVPGHPVLSGVLVIMALMMGTVPLSPHLAGVMGILFVLGLGEGTLDVGGNTLLVRVHRDHLDPYMNGLHFFFGVGALLSPLVVVRAMAMTGGIAWAYWALALSILPVAAYLLSLSSPGVRAVSRGGSVLSARPAMIVLVAGCFFFCVGAEAGFGGWVYTYSLKMGLADPGTAGYLTSGFWGALTLGRLVGIPISARFSPVAILFGDIVGGLISLGVILLWPHHLLALAAGTVGAGLSIASMFATLLNLAERHVTLSGRVTGWLFVGSSAGGMTVPWVIGQLFEPAGPRAAMVLIAVTLVLAAGVLGILMGRMNKGNESLPVERNGGGSG